MKKILLSLLCIFCLASCHAGNKLDEAFAGLDMPTGVRQNNHTAFYDYYLPSDMEEMDVNRVAGVFSYQQSKIVMNLNVSAIVNDRYYSEAFADNGFFDKDRLYYQNDGTFIDLENNEKEYHFRVYSYDECYIAYLECMNVNIYGYANPDELFDVTKKMLMMARNVTVRYEDVISKYSAKEVIDYQKKQLDLFSYNLPVNGLIDELLLEDAAEEDNSTEE